ncbi:MAG: TRAP transporter small permease [Desulfobacteraceae bacterium]|nr:MAG: TRAP transporter small permease [Desulfobacteraceae bacterium]
MARVIKRISFFLCCIGMVFVIPLMLLTTVDVISRAVWSKPIPGTFELSEYLLAIVILLGAAYTQQVKGHVGVDFVTKRFGPRLQALCEVLSHIGCMFILALLAWQGYERAMEETTVSDMLRIPQTPFRLLVALAGLTLFAEFLLELFQSLKTLIGGRQ